MEKSDSQDPRRNITLRKLVACSAGQQARIREIRNQPGIRASMYTEHEISPEEHRKWLSTLTSDPRQIIFAVLDDQARALGIVSVNALDLLHQKSDWAFYLDETERGGLGAALEFNFIDHVFNHLKIEKLNCEVIETNAAVVKLHKRFGFVEEGFRRENIIKNGQRIGVHFLGLTRRDWTASRNDVGEKYEATLSRFSVTIED